jgi:hypothetical protein
MTDTTNVLALRLHMQAPKHLADEAHTVAPVGLLREAADTIAALKAENDTIKNQNDHLRHNRVLQNSTIEKQAARIEALKEALTALVDETVDYMKINHLGDPEQKHNIKLARRALGARDD